MPENFRHFQWTVDPPVRTMSLKCRKISGTFKICGTTNSAMNGQSPTGLFLEVPLNYSTFYFCAIAVHWTCSEVRMLMELKRNLKTSYILDNLAILL